MNIKSLVEKLKKGDHQSYMKIYDCYFKPIHQFILRYVHAESVAEDLTQDVFVKVWEKRDYLDKVDNFNAYIYRIAKNHTLDYLKKVSRLEFMPDEILKEFRFCSDEVELFVTNQEYFHFLDAYMANLPAKSQQIFVLCREFDKSYDEVAAELSISKSTVKHHMVATMRKLSKEIKQKFKIDRFNSSHIIHFFKMFLPF